MTRLLKTPIIGPSEKTVASSWIDMLAGLSGLYIFKMPPCFWANAASTANIARNNEHAAAKPRRFGFISVHLPLAFAGSPRRLATTNPSETRGRTPLYHAHFLGSRGGLRPSRGYHLFAPRPERREVGTLAHLGGPVEIDHG